ncbi:Outer membrane protein (OmpH-like) [Posidoniimonas corsicana]|uniref:Outer membrane protein (OmpH-like) n=1 Tax=Posidoniimonas corsicana TaxID=1938618 RepID=A0A5C5VEW5_9BACT|nr:OmpH family outer membrane protein [Posidoniimonas corsicana]TWT36245.1 Outer membrane protein (OmpH-like) [Posidoniimonas corsicana]
MKTLPVAAIAALLFAAPAFAQNQAGINAPKYGFAVVDVNYVFKNHPQFREKLEGMQGEVQQIEQQLKGKAQGLMTLEQKRNSFKPGSDEFKKADEELATGKASFELEKNRLQKGFLEKEAKAYYEAYGQVQAEINRYAKHYKIGIVFRFNGEEPDPAIRQQILAGINKPVQYQDSVDITPDIIAMVKASYPAKNPSKTSVANPTAGNSGQY